MSLKLFLDIFWPELIRAITSKIQRIRRVYTNDAEKDTIINDDEKFQLICTVMFYGDVKTCEQMCEGL